MQVITPEFVKGKRVILRYDIDVALECKVQSVKCKVKEDFKLRAGLETLRLCLQNASKVIIIGHLGRPFKTVEDEKQGNPPQLSAKPVQQWFEQTLGQEVFFAQSLEEAKESGSKLILLENIRFFHGEVPGLDYHTTCTSKTCDVDFAHQLAALGDVYVNEAFSAYRPAVSTTILPTLLPHAAGLHFVREVGVLRRVRENPKKPLVAIMGGAKISEKVAVINVLAQKADAVLVGGKLVHEIQEESLTLPKNVMVGMLNEDGFDIAPQTVDAWGSLISKAAMIVWNGPLGKIQSSKFKVQSLGSEKGTYEVAKMILGSEARTVVGGGDTVAFLGSTGLLKEFEKKGFVSVGGGAMLKLLADGTLPTIEALR